MTCEASLMMTHRSTSFTCRFQGFARQEVDKNSASTSTCCQVHRLTYSSEESLPVICWTKETNLTGKIASCWRNKSRCSLEALKQISKPGFKSLEKRLHWLWRVKLLQVKTKYKNNKMLKQCKCKNERAKLTNENKKPAVNSNSKKP